MSLRNRFILPFALSILAVLAGCGSSNKTATPPPSGGFTNSNLSGTYVISTSGTDVNGSYLATAGTITANGSGGITGGTLDVNDADAGLNGAFQLFSTPIKSGNYSITSDGRGKANIETTLSTFTFDFVLSSDSHGLITEFDGSGTGSGTLDLQSATITQAQLSSYAFSLAGADTNGVALTTLGAFTLDGSGNVTAGGVEDFGDGGNIYQAQSLSGNMVLGSTGGSGTATLSSLFGSLNFDFFVIDATHVKFIETDPLPQAVLSGDVFQQTAMPSGQLVFTMSGLLTLESEPFAVGGFMTAGGAGQSNAGTFDDDFGGTPSPANVPFSFNYAAPTGGRTTIALSTFAGGLTEVVAYPTSGGLLMMDTDAGVASLGTAFAQTSTALATPPQGYGLNLTATNFSSGSSSLFELDDIAEFVTASGGTMTGLLDENDQGTPDPVQTIASNSVFTQDSPVTGRGEAQFNSSSTNTLFDVIFYTVDGTNTVFIDNDTFQSGVGSFQMQSGTATPAARPRPLTMVRVPMLHASAKHFKAPAKKQ